MVRRKVQMILISLSEFSQAWSFAALVELENEALAQFPESSALISHIANSAFDRLARTQAQTAWIEDLAELFGLPFSSFNAGYSLQVYPTK